MPGRNFFRYIITVPLLAACGGGGGETASFPAQLTSFDARFVQIAGGDVTPGPQLPTQGVVTYQGMVRLGLPWGLGRAADPYW
uniref:Uncharacterized protein n=1 Tax=Yoonia rhodophyticola TaxID=3137370 RepID=A0AAN0M6H0_9RHOB